MSGTSPTASNCLPTPAHRLLLQAALLNGDAALQAWAVWTASNDITAIDEGSFRLLPLVWHNLNRLGARSALMARLKGVHRQSWYRNQLLFRETAALVGRLEEVGIRTMLLKGVPLALQYYQDEGVRPMSDADVLVRPEDVPRAVAVLRESGWRPHRDPDAWPPEPRSSWSFNREDGREIDLHWRAVGPRETDDPATWESAVPLDLGGTATRSPGAADLLLHVLLHGLHWSPIPTVRWIADVSAIVRGAGTALDWRRLLDRAATLRVMPAVARGLRYAADLVRLELPESVKSELEHARLSPADRLALWSQMTENRWSIAVRMWFEYRGPARTGLRPARVAGLRRYLRGRLMISRDVNLALALGGRLMRRDRR